MVVTYYESPAYEVARILREKGYRIADITGEECYEPDEDVIGILKGGRRAPGGPIFGTLFGKRGLFIGRIFFNNKPRGAEVGKRWVLEVYGREYVEELRELAEELSSRYGVDIDVRLKSECPRVETYLWDYCS